MTGILGIIAPESMAVDPKQVVDLSHCMRARGKTHYLSYHKDNIGFGIHCNCHRAPSETLPQFDDFIIVYDGILKNKATLINEMGIAHDCSQAKVIAYGLRMQGNAFWNKIDGDIAIAAFDCQSRKLYLARDAFGKRPLYWCRGPNYIMFASTPTALIQHPRISRDIATTRLPEFFTFGYVSAPNTIYTAVSQVVPGHFLTYHRGTIETKRYWHYPLYAAEKEWKKVSALRDSRQYLQAAIKKYLDLQYAPNVLLDGGLASSVLVHELHQHKVKNIRTFTFHFDKPGKLVASQQKRRLKNAAIIAKKYGTKHEDLELTVFSPRAMTKLMQEFDQPIADIAYLPTQAVFKHLSGRVDAIFTSDGVNEVLGGFYRYTGMILGEELGTGFKRLLTNIVGDTPREGRGNVATLRRFLHLARQPSGLRMGHLSSFWPPQLLQRFLIGVPSEAVDEACLMAAYTECFDKSKNSSYFNRVVHAECCTHLCNTLLPTLDNSAMGYGIQAAVPFLDRSFVGHLARLHSSSKLKGFEQKPLLRALYRHPFAARIRSETTVEPYNLLHLWEHNTLANALKQKLVAPPPFFKAHFKQSFVMDMLNKHMSHKYDYGFPLYALYVFLIWLEHHEP